MKPVGVNLMWKGDAGRKVARFGSSVGGKDKLLPLRKSLRYIDRSLTS
jgi:hypothetical protein